MGMTESESFKKGLIQQLSQPVKNSSFGPLVWTLWLMFKQVNQVQASSWKKYIPSNVLPCFFTTFCDHSMIICSTGKCLLPRCCQLRSSTRCQAAWMPGMLRKCSHYKENISFHSKTFFWTWVNLKLPVFARLRNFQQICGQNKSL